MSIFVDKSTRVIVQGITGKEGSFWTSHMLDMGASVVAGVTPGKEGERVRDVPVYHSVRRAHDAHEADAAMLFVPPRFTKDAVFEALDAGLQKLGIFPYWIQRVYKPGTIGVMTRSGSLTNEVTAMIVREGFGVSTLIGVGGDPVPGTRFAEFLPAYQDDRETEGVVIVGELGGTMEEEIAEAIASGVFTKPLVAFIGGRTAPKGKRMGHAGAIVTGTAGTVVAKSEALTRAGALVASRPSQVGGMLRSLIPAA